MYILTNMSLLCCIRIMLLSMFLQNHPSDSWLAALQLSVQEASSDSTSETDMSKLLADQSFVSSILASVRLLRLFLPHFPSLY